MKPFLLVLFVVASSALRAEDARFVSVPMDRASGAKALVRGSLDDTWSAVPQGDQVFDGVPFDVRTKLQLAGNVDSKEGRYHVTRSLGIAVGQRLARLHLLHAANIPGLLDQPVAALQLHYANGATQTLFVTYGVHVRNYYKDAEEDSLSDGNSRLVWR